MTALSEKKRIVVVGAGIAGLSTAYMLRVSGRERSIETEITILESNDRHGGATRTDISDGYLCEWGPNGFLDNEPATLNLVERLNLNSELVPANENSARRFIYHSGKMRQLPSNPPAFLMSDILPLFSKLRIACELMIPAKRNGTEETVAAFSRRRLGKNFTKYMLDPMISGIFAGNIEKLALESIFPKIVEMETTYGGLFKALLAKKRKAKRSYTTTGGPAGPNATLHTFRKGMGQLTDSLAGKFEGNIKLSSTVDGINRLPDGWEVMTADQSIIADAVVLACPSHAAAGIIADFSPEVSKTIGGIYHAPVSVVCHGYEVNNVADRLNGFGVLIPRSEGIRSLGTLWSDSIFPGQAPQGQQLMRTIIGGAHDPEIEHVSDGDLTSIVVVDHHRVTGVSERPSYIRMFRHPKGIAQYNIGHLTRVKACEDFEKQHLGLYFTGASYRGVSVNGCVKDACRIAKSFWEREKGAI